MQLLFGAICEVLEGTPQQAHLPLYDGAVLYLVGGEGGDGLQILWLQEALPHKDIWANEQRVARERRERGIRRVAVAGRCQGKDLPELLARLFQEVNEAVGFLAEVAYAVGPGKTGGVEQNAA